MAVYLVTAHAYRSWKEDHPRGYVQRGEGLKESSRGMAVWRAGKATDAEARFDQGVQTVLHKVVVEIAKEREMKLHACATCPTHVHGLFSFRSPACECGVLDHCRRDCGARKNAEEFIVRLKQKMGLAAAKHVGTRGRKWFSRGWDLSSVRKREHFDYLVGVYLPDHEKTQGGMFRRYV